MLFTYLYFCLLCRRLEALLARLVQFYHLFTALWLHYLAGNIKTCCLMYYGLLQKGESVKKMREEVSSPEEIFRGILLMIPVTCRLDGSLIAHLVHPVCFSWPIFFRRVELASTSQRGTVQRGSSPWRDPPPPSLKPSLWSSRNWRRSAGA